ncbi:MAG TPA: hypothetical protein VE871_19065, partial [Longimicrobium sp.]|nr:hypothetical protein [Longimicrobium sp.]
MPRKHSAAPSKHPRTAGKGNQQQQRVELPDTLRKMSREYRGNETGAVRSQRFIKHLHEYLESQLNARLSKKAETRGVIVKPEAKIYGAIRPKDVDVAV